MLLLFFKTNEEHKLTEKYQHQKFQYLLSIIQEDEKKIEIKLYSNHNRYSVRFILEAHWDNKLRAYKFRQAEKQIVIPKEKILNYSIQITEVIKDD